VKNTALIRLLTVLLLIPFLAIGCGNRSAQSSRTLNGFITSFEVLPSDSTIGDFDLETNGYVNLEQSKKYVTNGKYSCKAVFSVPVDFVSTTQAAKTQSWIAGITMSIKTMSKLPITDWSLFKKFSVDITNPDNVSKDFFIKLTDAQGKEYLAAPFALKSGRNKLEINIEDVKTARVDVANIIAFQLYIDTKSDPKDITLYIDNIHLVP